MKLKLSELHKENMRTHIAFLRDNADRIRKHFDMTFLYNPVYIGCGTPACSLGWATVSLNIKDINLSEGSSKYLFGIPNVCPRQRKTVWDYLFNGEWFDVNNTPEAAAARMEAVLYDQVPERWDYTEEFAHPIVNIPIISESKTLEYVG